MAYNKKTWLARLGQGLNKFILNGGSKVTLESSPDTVTQQGTPLSAENMNDLEQRIADEFSNQSDAINAINGVDQTAGKSVNFGAIVANGVGRDNNVDTFIQFPFLTRNTNYSVSITGFQIYNIVGKTTNFSIYNKYKNGVTVRYETSSNKDERSWWTIIDSLSITFA